MIGIQSLAGVDELLLATVNALTSEGPELDAVKKLRKKVVVHETGDPTKTRPAKPPDKLWTRKPSPAKKPYQLNLPQTTKWQPKLNKSRNQSQNRNQKIPHCHTKNIWHLKRKKKHRVFLHQLRHVKLMMNSKISKPRQRLKKTSWLWEAPNRNVFETRKPKRLWMRQLRSC